MKTPLKAPFPYPGGKSIVADRIWTAFGADINNYVEAFAGSLAVLLRAPAVPNNETVNDLDGHLTNFWRAVKYRPDETALHADYPVSELDLHARHRWLVAQRPNLTAALEADPDFCDPKAAGWWVWGICQWIAGPWCPVTENRIKRERPSVCDKDIHARGKESADHRKRPRLDRGDQGVLSAASPLWQPRPDLSGSRGINGRSVHLARGEGVHNKGTQTGSIADWFDALSARLRRTRIVCGDWRRVLTKSPTTYLGATAVLLDPPYGSSRDPDLYAVESRETIESLYRAVYEWAVANGGNPKLRIALCCHNDLPRPDGWFALPWRTPGGMSRIGKGNARTRGHANRDREVIYFSPHCHAHSSQIEMDFG